MGRIRTHKKIERTLASSRADSKTTSKQEPTIVALLQKTQEFISRYEYELALKFIERILSKNPDNLEALGYLGTIQIEGMEDTESAKKTFTTMIQKASSMSISPPALAHLYLAQLEDEDPRIALGHYQAAVDILHTSLKGKDAAISDGGTDESETRRTAIRALIGMVEIYMTDLCFEPEAEEKCEEYLRIALQFDPESPEALQSLASVRISQSRNEEARELVKRAWITWNAIQEGDPHSPTTNILFSLTRTLLELSEYNTAADVLHNILAMDEEDVESWYLKGWCSMLMAKEIEEKFPINPNATDSTEWRALAADAKYHLEKSRELHVLHPHSDEGIISHCDELLQELDQKGVVAARLDREDEISKDYENDEDGWTDTDNEMDEDA